MPGRLPRGMEAGLFETGTYDGGVPTFPNGCHVCEVEIDPETGQIEILRYNAVDEVGRVVNPLLLEGQVHGGIAQAVGQCLMEDINYDRDSGQLMSGSFMDYGMPRATDMPSFAHGDQRGPDARPTRSASRAPARPARSARCRPS